MSTLPSHLALPRDEHLDAAVHVMASAQQMYNSKLVYNPAYLDIDCNVFKKYDCTQFYHDAKEAIFINAPKPRDKKVDS